MLAVVLGSEASIQPQGSAVPDSVALLPDAIGSAAGGACLCDQSLITPQTQPICFLMNVDELGIAGLNPMATRLKVRCPSCMPQSTQELPYKATRPG